MMKLKRSKKDYTPYIIATGDHKAAIRKFCMENISYDIFSFYREGQNDKLYVQLQDHKKSRILDIKALRNTLFGYGGKQYNEPHAGTAPLRCYLDLVRNKHLLSDVVFKELADQPTKNHFIKHLSAEMKSKFWSFKFDPFVHVNISFPDGDLCKIDLIASDFSYNFNARLDNTFEEVLSQIKLYAWKNGRKGSNTPRYIECIFDGVRDYLQDQVRYYKYKNPFERQAYLIGGIGKRKVKG